MSRLTLERAVILAAVVATAAALLGLPGRATNGMWTSGDEPHYLVTAISLGRDGDLDVSDEIAGNEYRDFHEPGLKPQAAERPDGSMVVPHDPLLPALLALPMRLGGAVAAKSTLAVLAGALAALLVWTMVRRFAVPIVTATVVTVAFTAAAPLAVYGHQVYPELPAALAVTAAVAALTGRLGRGGLVAVGLAVVALPWLSIKYAPVAAALAGIALVRLWTGGRRRSALVFAGVMAAAGVAYVVGHVAWYDGATAYASGRYFQGQGGQISVVGTDPDYLGRSRRLVGLLVDRGFGLAAWQPAWLLAAPALGALVGARARGWTELTLPWAAGWVTATFVALTMHGWWFPGRQVVVVLPLLAIAIGWWVGRSRAKLAAVAVGGGLGVVSHVWLAVEAARREVTWVVDFAATSNPWYGAWRAVLPDHLRPSAEMWTLHAVWTVVLVALLLWGWRSGRAVRGRLGRSGPGPRTRSGPRTGAGSRTRSGAGRLATTVDLPDVGTVVGGARREREREGQDSGGGRASDRGASHEGTSQDGSG